MPEAIDPIELGARVQALLDRHDGGDLLRAARRIGARPSELRAIVEGMVERPSLSTLSAIVRGYDVDAWWLISGETGIGADLPAERRVLALNLLSELASAMTMQRRLQYRDAGTTPFSPRDGATIG